MNASPDLLAALEVEIQRAPVAELPAIGGGLEALRLKIQVRLTPVSVPPPPPEAAETGDRLLTAAEVAERLGQKVDWVYAHKHELPIVKVPGRTLRFSESALKRWIQRRREN